MSRTPEQRRSAFVNDLPVSFLGFAPCLEDYDFAGEGRTPDSACKLSAVNFLQDKLICWKGFFFDYNIQEQPVPIPITGRFYSLYPVIPTTNFGT